MKPYITILLALITSYCAAQTVTPPEGYEARENLRELGSVSGTGSVQTFDNRYEGTKGTPYVFEAWAPGEIFLKSKKKGSVPRPKSIRRGTCGHSLLDHDQGIFPKANHWPGCITTDTHDQ